MTIDWDKFSTRINAGKTLVRNSVKWEGILLEDKPYSAEDWHAARGALWTNYDRDTDGRSPNALKLQYLYATNWTVNQENNGYGSEDVTILEYFINDQWLTFEQVMS